MMPDYPKMYQILFQAANHACRLLAVEDCSGAKSVLEHAQQMTEMVFIESSLGVGYDPKEYVFDRIVFPEDYDI